jgi:hypothetical protein
MVFGIKISLTPLATHNRAASRKKAGIYYPGFRFWGRRGVRRYEIYLQFVLEKSDDRKIADSDTVRYKKGRTIL